MSVGTWAVLVSVVQWVKVLVAKPEVPCLKTVLHVVERENYVLQVVP